MNPEVRLELQQLLSALHDGELTEDQHSRLEELLGTGPDAQRMYLEYLDMHARLLLHPRLGTASPLPPGGEHAHTTAGDEIVKPMAFPNASPPPVPARSPVRQALPYVAVACAAVAATLLVQVLWRPAPAPIEDHSAPLPPGYVATLSQTAACVWDNPGEPRRAGSRLVPGELRLEKGIARVRFDGGPELVLEGPTVVRLDTATAATVLQGKVVFKGDDTAAPFRLSTPSSTLIDRGTEYAVLVSPEREEVHVFDGEVERTPLLAAGEAEPEHLAAGAARRYEPAAGGPGQPTPLDAARFVRQVADPARDPAAGLLAYEGFDYRDAEGLQQGTLNGGQGWASPWRPGFARPPQKGDPERPALNVREGLSRAGASIPAVGGSFDHTGFAKYFRRLAVPVRLGSDEVYYLSYLFRRDGPPVDLLNAVTVQLRTSDELERELAMKGGDPRLRLNVGVDQFNHVFTHLQRIGVRAPLPLSFGESYLLVAKVVASSAHPDQVFVRIYAPGEPVEREEEGGWSIAGPLVHSDLMLDWLEVHINSGTRQTIDEVRLGTTWSSVTAPWAGARGVKPGGQP